MPIFKIILLAAFSGAVILSCSKNFLDKDNLGLLVESDIANKRGVENLLIGAYSLLDGVGGNGTAPWGSAGSNWIYGSVCGTEAYTGSYDGDGGRPDILILEKFEGTATNDNLAGKWGTVYDGIQRANEVLRIMAKATDISAEDQKRIAGEARFLRGHYHFEAKKMWNQVPFIDESITYPDHNYHVGNERNIWPDIEADIKFAVDNLEEEPYQGAVGRATKFTAMALLAKAYMFQNNFAEAKPLLENIIQSGKFALVSYADNFNPDLSKKNRGESIFSAQTSVNDGSEGGNGNSGDILNFPMGGPSYCCGFFNPTQYLVNHFKTSAAGLPDPDHFNDDNVPNDEGLESADPSFLPYNGTLDPRLDWTVGRRGIPYLDWGLHPGKDWIRNGNQQLDGPYSPKKNVFYKSQVGILSEVSSWSYNETTNNIKLIRYADVLLWAAEVEANIGSLPKAEEYVNMIRNRAADPAGWVHTYIDPDDPSKGFTNIAAANYFIKPYPDGDFEMHGPAYALRAIRYERMLELGMEGHRLFDLVRWGIASEEINNYLEKEKTRRPYLNAAGFTKGTNEYFPIPQRQIDLSAGADGIATMIQNPGY